MISTDITHKIEKRMRKFSKTVNNYGGAKSNQIIILQS